ncbi:DUF5133 domain-containing protein [Streptomyces xanthochromogenes]|uniref:DUF5133 domain-containing protein n=1 Tax=Streptomyces xanthochromogenes TaxID=67384 RepID=UPI0037FB4687
MLMAHPAVLRNLLDQYETLCALQAENGGTSEVHGRLDDLAYTLCVSTGTRDIGSALAAAHHQLTGAVRYSREEALQAA